MTITPDGIVLSNDKIAQKNLVATAVITYYNAAVESEFLSEY
jgi:hypothetical protein